MRLGLCAAVALLTLSFPALGAGRRIEVNTLVEASRADVWRAWTTGEGWKEFCGAEAKIELRPGGAYEVYFKPDAPEGSRGSEGCEVLSYEPGRMVSFSWGAPPTMPRLREARGQIVVVTLLDEGTNRTRVRLTHHHWPENGGELQEIGAAQAYFEKAWPSVLEAMRDHFARVTKPAGKDAEARTGKGLRQFEYLITLSNPKIMTSGATTEEQEALSGHVRYVNDLHARGLVLFAGRPMDASNSPGAVVFLARDEDEARSIAENDPAVAAGVFRMELHPYRLILQHTP